MNGDSGDSGVRVLDACLQPYPLKGCNVVEPTPPQKGAIEHISLPPTLLSVNRVFVLGTCCASVDVLH